MGVVILLINQILNLRAVCGNLVKERDPNAAVSVFLCAVVCVLLMPRRSISCEMSTTHVLLSRLLEAPRVKALVLLHAQTP